MRDEPAGTDSDQRSDPNNRVHDERPWGSFTVLDDAPAWKVKRITVRPGERLSYQRHNRRAEHWVIIHGRAVVTLDDVDHELAVGDTVEVPVGGRHRIANPGPDAMSFIEVQTGDYFGEDDIVRLDDDYGRADSRSSP